MRKFFCSLCLFMAVTFSLYAQSNDSYTSDSSVAEQAAVSDAGYGTFVKSDNNTLVVSEYDGEKDAQRDVVYTIDGNTKFTGVADAKSIAAGVNLEITYEVKDGARVAKAVLAETVAQE